LHSCCRDGPAVTLGTGCARLQASRYLAVGLPHNRPAPFRVRQHFSSEVSPGRRACSDLTSPGASGLGPRGGGGARFRNRSAVLCGITSRRRWTFPFPSSAAGFTMSSEIADRAKGIAPACRRQLPQAGRPKRTRSSNIAAQCRSPSSYARKRLRTAPGRNERLPLLGQLAAIAGQVLGEARVQPARCSAVAVRHAVPGTGASSGGAAAPRVTPSS
jgi:hypothetical protein